MGMFMASVAFRCDDKQVWMSVKPEIMNMFAGIRGLSSNLYSEGPGYVILSPYGDMGKVLSDMPERISALTGDYAVFALCNDSDFNMMELYHNGSMLESSCIGEVYEEFAEFMEVNPPDLNLWKQLLLDPTQEQALEAALLQVEVCSEDNLRELSRLTGLPIFDDSLMFP